MLGLFLAYEDSPEHCPDAHRDVQADPLLPHTPLLPVSYLGSIKQPARGHH